MSTVELGRVQTWAIIVDSVVRLPNSLVCQDGAKVIHVGKASVLETHSIRNTALRDAFVFHARVGLRLDH